VSPPRRRHPSPVQPEEQPALPLDVPEGTPPARVPRRRRLLPVEQPGQFSFAGALQEDAEAEEAVEEGESAVPAAEDLAVGHGSTVPASETTPTVQETGEAEIDVDPPGFDADPFAEIPGHGPGVAPAGEYVLLPASLRGRLDLRELTRFLGALPTVIKDWEGAPDVEEGGVRLRGVQGGAWIYPEARRVRLVTDGEVRGPVAEDLIAVCRWLEARAGMRLYPEGESPGPGADRSLDPWDVFG
jgi:hypothetical protein